MLFLNRQLIIVNYQFKGLFTYRNIRKLQLYIVNQIKKWYFPKCIFITTQIENAYSTHRLNSLDFVQGILNVVWLHWSVLKMLIRPNAYKKVWRIWTPYKGCTTFIINTLNSRCISRPVTRFLGISQLYL